MNRSIVHRAARAARLGAALGLLLAGGATATATAGMQTVTNSCQYSYDAYWRDMPVTFGGTASPSTAAPGDTVRLGDVRFDVELPDWLAEYGYNFGLLDPGENELPTEVWMAIRATNTVEGVQWQKFDTVARTTITVNPATGAFDEATDFVYDVPPLSSSDWTARGGPIAFSQARPDALPPIPVGAGGANRTVRGSAFLHVDLGGLFLGLDCVPGGFVADGSAFTERLATPFATVDVPAFQCVNPLTPTGTSAAAVGVELDADPVAPATLQPGGTLTTRPRVRYRIPNAYLAALATAGRLPEGDNELGGTLTVALAATGATPAVQTATATIDDGIVVRVGPGGAPVTVRTTTEAGTAESADLVTTGVLTPTTWTAGTAGAVQLAAGAPGVLATVALGGGTSATPYGTAYARLQITPETAPMRRLSLDCVSGEVAIGDAGIAYGERGDVAPASGGDAGRYAIDGNALDAFAIVPVEGVPVTPDPGPGPSPEPDPGPAPAPGPVPPPIVPIAAPAPPVVAATPPAPARPAAKPSLSVRSTSLRLSSGRVKVRLRCAGTERCSGRVRLRTAAKVRLRRGAKAKVVTVTGTVRYRVAAGRTATVTLKLGRSGRTLLRRVRAVKVRVLVAPSSGRATSRRVTLRR